MYAMDKRYYNLVITIQEAATTAAYMMKNINYMNELDDADGDEVDGLISLAGDLKRRLEHIIIHQHKIV